MNRHRILIVAVLVACALESASAQQIASPAVYLEGELPAVPFFSMGVGGGEVILELTVTINGSVSAVRPLRVTPSFVEPLAEAARSWRFSPAEEFVPPAERRPGERDKRPIESKVLVAALIRPPTLNSPTFGEPVQDVSSPSLGTPFPLSTTVPPYPATAYSPGVTLVELRLDPSGVVIGARVVRSAPPFDDASLTAAGQWKFDPPRVRGVRSPSLVYVVFGFPRPVV